jgi:hypothetical protein
LPPTAKPMNNAKHIARLPLLIALCLGMIAAFAIDASRRERGLIGSAVSIPRGTITAAYSKGGPQLTLVVVGTRRLASKDARATIATLRAFRDSISRIAESRSLPLSVIGASIDRSPDEGVLWLRAVGGFDEIIAGGGWAGVAAERFVWKDSTTRAAVPQVRVLLRVVRADTASVRVLAERAILTLVGYPALDSSLTALTKVRSALDEALSVSLRRQTTPTNSQSYE